MVFYVLRAANFIIIYAATRKTGQPEAPVVVFRRFSHVVYDVAGYANRLKTVFQCPYLMS